MILKMLPHLLLRKVLPESRIVTKVVIIKLFGKKTELFVRFVPKRKCKWCVKNSEKEKENVSL